MDDALLETFATLWMTATEPLIEWVSRHILISPLRLEMERVPSPLARPALRSQEACDSDDGLPDLSLST